MVVTELLASAHYEGGSDEALLRRLSRLEQHNIDIGDKYHDYRFFALVEFIVAELCKQLDFSEINEKLNGLGTAGHYSVMSFCCTNDKVNPAWRFFSCFNQFCFSACLPEPRSTNCLSF